MAPGPAATAVDGKESSSRPVRATTMRQSTPGHSPRSPDRVSPGRRLRRPSQAGLPPTKGAVVPMIGGVAVFGPLMSGTRLDLFFQRRTDGPGGHVLCFSSSASRRGRLRGGRHGSHRTTRARRSPGPGCRRPSRGVAGAASEPSAHTRAHAQRECRLNPETSMITSGRFGWPESLS